MQSSTTFQGFLDRLVADARSELGLPATPPLIPSLDSIIEAMCSRARAELADDARELERGNPLAIDFDFVARVDRWARLEDSYRAAADTGPADLSDLWRYSTIAGHTPGITARGGAATERLQAAIRQVQRELGAVSP